MQRRPFGRLSLEEDGSRRRKRRDPGANSHGIAGLHPYHDVPPGGTSLATIEPLMSAESERVWWWRACAVAAVALSASAAVGRQADSRGASAPPAKQQAMTLADARAAFAAADVDRDNRLAAAELAAAGLSADDVKLADRDRDGALRSEEFLGGLPLVLSRAGKRASPELEAEAIRLRALGAPAASRTPATLPSPNTTPATTTPPSGSVPPAPAAGTEAGSAARERLASALRGPVQPPKSTRQREQGLSETGPAVTRLRTAPSASEAEARLKAARDSLAERLQRSSAGPEEPPRGVPDSVSGQRRRAQEAEHNDATPTAARLRAARQKLDERIRSSNTPSDPPAPDAANPPAGTEPAPRGAERPRGAPPEPQAGATPRSRTGADAPPRESPNDVSSPAERPRTEPPDAR